MAASGTELARVEQMPLLAIEDARPKDDRVLMEYPFFSISKTPRHEPIIIKEGDFTIEVQPSHKGIPTVWDKDLLIYVSTLIMNEVDRGRPPSRTVRFHAHDFMKLTGRGGGQSNYKRLEDTLDRLAGSRVKTSIPSGGKQVKTNFGWIDNYRIIQRTVKGGRTIAAGIEVVLNDWSFQALVEEQRVLTISRDYFSITGGIERRLYELARKHCGKQKEWRISLARLAEKCGVDRELRKFKADLKKICNDNRLPDYQIDMREETNAVTLRFRPKDQTVIEARPAALQLTGEDAWNKVWTAIAKQMKDRQHDSTNLHSVIIAAKRSGNYLPAQFLALFDDSGAWKSRDPVGHVRDELARRAKAAQIAAAAE
jgi:plasmid replication initiation protein